VYMKGHRRRPHRTQDLGACRSSAAQHTTRGSTRLLRHRNRPRLATIITFRWEAESCQRSHD
jgi:hypothetical protein